MPRVPRAKAEAAKASDVSGWLDAATAEQTLQRLCGLWRDRMGSTYALRLGSEGVMEVRTTRPRGRTMRTRGLIHVQRKEDRGRVVWGRKGARAVFTIAKLEESALVWRSSRSKPFHWDRLSDVWPDDEEDEPEDESGYDDSEEEDEEDWAWQTPYGGGAWDEGWDEGWDDGWDEGWWEEDEEWQESWQDDHWAAPQEQETASDAAKRRSELRKKLQETRRQVTEQVSGKTETSARRWKQNKAEKPVYRKVERADESEKSTAVGDASRDAGGDPEATTEASGLGASEASKSLLGDRTQQKGRAGARGWQVKAPAKDGVAEPEPTSAAAQDAAAREPELRPPRGCPQDKGAAGHELSGRGSLPLCSPPTVSGQEQDAACALNHGREVGERLLSELCSGVASKSASLGADAGGSPGSSRDAAHVNRLEHVVQGFLGQPWFTPAWSSNSSGWAFDLQWVTSMLEGYFSDANLCGDAHLRSLMMPGEGWVPLILLLTLPRLQTLGVDHMVLGQAAMVSTSLELDTTGHYARIRDKARRARWLPICRPG